MRDHGVTSRCRASPPAIIDRLGLDSSPIDINDPDQVRWLTACVWPDQTRSLRTPRAAITIAAERPARDRPRRRRRVAGRLCRIARPHRPPRRHQLVGAQLPRRRRPHGATWRRSTRSDDERDLSWVFAEALALCPEISEALDVPTSHVTNLVRVRWHAGAARSNTSPSATPTATGCTGAEPAQCCSQLPNRTGAHAAQRQNVPVLTRQRIPAFSTSPTDVQAEVASATAHRRPW